MKSSFYNMIIPAGSGKYVLYNTLKDAILLIDEELKCALEKGEFNIPEQHLAVLKRLGMVVDDDAGDAIQQRIYQYMFNSRKYDITDTFFTVLPTYACNLACPYCYEGAGTVISHSMDEKTAENVAAFMKNMVEEHKSHNVFLKLYGGEPLVNLEAVFMLSDSLSHYSQEQDKGFYIILQTNGTLLTEDVAENLSRHLVSVEMTLEGDKEYHDTIRFYKKGGGTYEDIMNAVQLLIEKNIHVALRINASEAGHLDLLLKDMKRRGLEGQNFSFYVTQTSDFGLHEFFTEDTLCFRDEKKAVELIPELRAVVDQNGLTENLTIFDTLQRQKILPCASERRGRYVVDPLGDVYLCFFTAGQKEHCIGTIGEEGTIEWNSSFYEIMGRSPLEFSECRQCTLLPMCGGGCHIRAHKNKGTYLAPYCGNTKEMAEERIKLYLRQRYPERFGGLL